MVGCGLVRRSNGTAALGCATRGAAQKRQEVKYKILLTCGLKGIATFIVSY